jgi:hypothetical protein
VSLGGLPADGGLHERRLVHYRAARLQGARLSRQTELSAVLGRLFVSAAERRLLNQCEFNRIN